MSMSDTAEYWSDVKSRPYSKPKKVFTHLKSLECGHFHVISSKKIGQVDCYACLALIESTPSLKLRMDQNKKSVELRNQKVQKITCTCGKRMVIRENKISKVKFLGCSGFPSCTQTKALEP